jgi:hypothetical protein
VEVRFARKASDAVTTRSRLFLTERAHPGVAPHESAGFFLDPADQTEPEVSLTAGTNYTIARVEFAPLDSHSARIDLIDRATYRADDVGLAFLPCPDDRSILSLLEGTPFDEIPRVARSITTEDAPLHVKAEVDQLRASHHDFASSIGADAEELFGQ